MCYTSGITVAITWPGHKKQLIKEQMCLFSESTIQSDS